MAEDDFISRWRKDRSRVAEKQLMLHNSQGFP